VSAYQDEDEDYDYDYDPDDFYDDQHYEPDEADYAYERMLAEEEEHCEQAHGGADCDCRAPLADRIREGFREARRRVRAILHRSRYSDEPPF
jgi:hypothetical protein